MSTSLLASVSTNVKIWDITAITRSIKVNGSFNSSTPEQLFGVESASFKPESASETVNEKRPSLNSFTSYYLDQRLAVAGNEGTLTIYDSQGNPLESITSKNEGSKVQNINSVHFANKSRYLLFGGSDKVVNVWDRESSTFVDPLKGHRGDITCIDLNIDETIVASSSASGHILLHNRLKSNACDNLVVLTKQSINVLEYSFFKRGLLAAGGDDGSLRLWDTGVSTTALQTFENVHHFAIKGETREKNLMDIFSPVKDTSVEEVHSILKPKENTIKEKQQSTRNNEITKDLTKINTRDPKLDERNVQDEVKGDSVLFNNSLITGTLDSLKTKIISKVKETISNTEGLSVNNSDSLPPNIISPKKRVSFADNEMASENLESSTEKPFGMSLSNGINETHDAPILTEMVLSPDEITPAFPPPLTKTSKEGRETISTEVTTTLPTPNLTVSKDIPVPSENTNNTVPATNFQLQVIGNVIDECLQEFRISLRNDIQNMHLELLRQFHIQKVRTYYY
ncbi:6828_t:CDS:2 [Acaulospora colombiana]|uniref:6828_t:CDS:1 n=1 Tax=Acaulospora colombiana TaxID=27376 RepID=A0ACA9KLF5_9GLOM|nr:6828_t:CDS:2 [Acaulospora colombiana]